MEEEKEKITSVGLPSHDEFQQKAISIHLSTPVKFSYT